MTSEEREALAWAAGFFDGEGHTGFKSATRDMQVGITQKTRDVLDRFQRAVQLGNVNGPYPTKPRGRPQYFSYSVQGRRGVIEVMEKISPWLSQEKLGQYLKVRQRMEASRSSEHSPSV